jgi:hypothetical protein
VPQPPDTYSPLCPDAGAAGELAGQPGRGPGSSSAPVSPHEALVFTSPDQGSVFRIVPDIPADKQKIRVSVRPANGVNAERIALLINGQPLGEGAETLWQMAPGDYTFEAIGLDAAGNQISARKVTVKVVQ